jgi:hypothetical protein
MAAERLKCNTRHGKGGLTICSASPPSINAMTPLLTTAFGVARSLHAALSTPSNTPSSLVLEFVGASLRNTCSATSRPAAPLLPTCGCSRRGGVAEATVLRRAQHSRDGRAKARCLLSLLRELLLRNIFIEDFMRAELIPIRNAISLLGTLYLRCETGRQFLCTEWRVGCKTTTHTRPRFGIAGPPAAGLQQQRSY